jgi:hypothetical protein
MKNADATVLLQPAFTYRPGKARSGWSCSAVEKRVVLTALFLTLVWPVYLTVALGPVNITPARVAAALAMLVVGLCIVTIESRAMQFIRILRFNSIMITLFFFYIFWRLAADFGSAAPAASYLLTVLDIVSSGFFLITLMVVAMDSTDSIIECIFWTELILIAAGLFELFAQFSIAPYLVPFSSMTAEQLAGYAGDTFRGDVFRVRSLSSHPILFGSLLAAGMPILLHLRVNGRRRYIRLLSVILFIASPVLLFATNARSALAGAVISVLTYYLIRAIRSGRRNPVLLLLLIMGSAILVLGSMATSAASGGIDAVTELISGRDNIERSSSESRIKMLDRGMDALNSRPIMGYGDGEAIEIAGLTNANNLRTIDSYFLVSAVNFGYFGLFINVCLLLAILWGGISASTKMGADIDQDAIAGLTAASMCILTCAVTVTSSEYFVIVYALGAVSAAATARPEQYMVQH